MIEQPHVEWGAIAPEVILAVGAMVVLLLGLIKGEWNRVITSTAGIATSLVATVASVSMLYGNSYTNAFAGHIDGDQLANVARIVVCVSAAIAGFLAFATRPRDGFDGEFHALVLLAATGMGLFAAAGTLVTVFVGLELFSISLYALVALETGRTRALEAGIKYLVMGGFASAVLLYGAALVYGATGTFDLGAIGASDNATGIAFGIGVAMVLLALAFKASAAPLHMWAPDVYDGAATPVTMFMASATKVVAILALMRVAATAFPGSSDMWMPLIAALAAISIIVGNAGALVQDSVKRMLAYSSIAQAGYLLIGVVAWQEIGVTALVYALVVYALTTFGAFALVLIREMQVGRTVTFADFEGMGFRGGGAFGGLSAVAFLVLMLSLAGIPPFGGFFAKMLLFLGAVQAEYAWLAVIGVIGSLVSLVYYLRIPIALAQSGGNVDDVPSRPKFAPVIATIGVLSAALVLYVGIFPGQVIEEGCEAREVFTASEGFTLTCERAVAIGDGSAALSGTQASQTITGE